MGPSKNPKEKATTKTLFLSNYHYAINSPIKHLNIFKETKFKENEESIIGFRIVSKHAQFITQSSLGTVNRKMDKVLW